MDAITLLKDDHDRVEKLFVRFEKASPRAGTVKADIVARIIRELSVHAVIEEQVFYPAVRHEAPEASDYVLDSLEEHHIVKWLLSELDGMTPDDERFDSKVRVLIENVRYHVGEEETQLFPEVRTVLGGARLDELGGRLVAAKRRAPTHPHPRLPDSHLSNVIGGTLAGAVDRARDAGKKVMAEAKHAVG
jgi:hemerythrin superfamily protein